jgi:hypothetical protein
MFGHESSQECGVQVINHCMCADLQSQQLDKTCYSSDAMSVGVAENWAFYICTISMELRTRTVQTSEKQ